MQRMMTMTTKDEDFRMQMDAARQVMDDREEALSALAGNAPSRNLQEAMEIARERLEKYQTVYRALSK